ncbi:pirin family protein [Leeia oryzae]|uniref:pirin family protein n=1 Tax=Leeia oryzae TaxID=356662 RepID=UPI00036EA53C|nr:pirin family protein [Leeia oryzae]
MNPIQRIEAKATDLGEGMIVYRALPTKQCRMIGAWCFLDHAGPMPFAPGQGMHVGAHPHTSLQTFSWLIEGEVLHRDSLGSKQVIRPGEVNLMTAGHGIVHTEDTLPEATGMHLAQLWIALPSSAKDCAPAFDHYPVLPRWVADHCTFTLLAGTYAGHTAPATLYTPLIGMDVLASAATTLTLPLDPAFEYGLFALEGGFTCGAEAFNTNELAYLGAGSAAVTVELTAGTRLLLLGGEPFAEQITMWWNFVGHSKEDIMKAQQQWAAKDPRFGVVDNPDERRLVAPPLPWAGS